VPAEKTVVYEPSYFPLVFYNQLKNEKIKPSEFNSFFNQKTSIFVFQAMPDPDEW
jgi:hypothetical protein